MQLAKSFNQSNVRSRRLIFMFLTALILIGLVGMQRLLFEYSLSISGSNATERDLAYWQENASQRTKDRQAQTLLGFAYLQEARVTGEVENYALAEESFDAALALDEQFQSGQGYGARSLDALIGLGILTMARHDFEGALLIGEQAHTINPYRAQVYGILVDANVELGHYDQALKLAQEMVDLRPDLASYSRIAYLRELHGDSAGAIRAMEAAVSSGVPGTEQMAWTQFQLGSLYWERGDLDNAEAIYREALHFRPGYTRAQEGIAQVKAARGDTAAAIAIMQSLLQEQELPEFAIFLGELYGAAGDTAAAKEQYDLARALFDRNMAAGMNETREMAQLEADHGDAQRAVTLARMAFENQPTVLVADTLAWSLYKNGQIGEAWEYSQEAMRLGSADAHIYLHAALIAQALGDEAAAADLHTAALEINPIAKLPQ